MAYTKTEWKARKGINLKRQIKESETAQSVILHNEPSRIEDPGTPFSVENMNKIEGGIFDAHEMIAAEETARVAHQNNKSNPHSVTKAQVGLGNVDNTSDVNKPVSDATQAALTNHNTSNASHADIRNIIANLTGIPSYNENTHVITFTAHNGSTLDIDLPIEALTQDIDYDPLTKELILTKQNGAAIRVSVSDLVDTYLGHIGANIQTTIGENNTIRAVLLNNSVKKEQLDAAVRATLDKADSALQSVPNNHITTEKIADGAVTAEKLAAGALGGAVSDSHTHDSLQGKNVRNETLDLNNYFPWQGHSLEIIYSTFDGGTANISNKPNANAFLLELRRHRQVSAADYRMSQTWYSTNTVRRRFCNNGTWTAWKIIAQNDVVPIEAGGTGAATAAEARANIGAAAASHGNHVPATQAANNKKFLRNDNSWQDVTPSNIGAAADSHGHVYTGSDANNTNYPVGSYVAVNVNYSNTHPDRNGSMAIFYSTVNENSFSLNGANSPVALGGTWRSCGIMGNGYCLYRKVAS